MNMEFNKIFAAFLVAGIIAMLGGFIARETVHPKHLEENAFKIEVADVAPADGSAAPAGPEPIDVAAADIAQGEKVAKVCASCHTFDNGGADKVGPNLFNVVGGKHAHRSSFAYSDAMKAKSGETWSEDALNAFLWNPRKALPGTKMSFAGVKKPEDRAALIKWMAAQK